MGMDTMVVKVAMFLENTTSFHHSPKRCLLSYCNVNNNNAYYDE